MTPVLISDEIKKQVHAIKLSCIECDVIVRETEMNLLAEINKKASEVASTVNVEQISRIPAIAASRKAYKALGKDPARYRLSAEALLRRVVQGKGLYSVNNVVDLLNLVSVSTGYSIGGYDADKIEGDVVLGTGRKNEPYLGIGRGDMNIEALPVFRDKKGALGTPTSDSMRTAVTSETRKFLMVILHFGEGNLDEATEMAVALLKLHAGGKNFQNRIITS